MSNKKYPTTRQEYTQHVGALQEEIVAEIVRDLIEQISDSSWKLLPHEMNSNGSDIEIRHRGKTIGKFEVMNEDLGSYINKARAEGIRKNLAGVRYKGLIHNHISTIRKVKETLKNTPTYQLGFQTLPEEYFNFYLKENSVFKRKIDCRKTRKLLKKKILAFFKEIGLLELMYIDETKIDSYSRQVDSVVKRQTCKKGEYKGSRRVHFEKDTVEELIGSDWNYGKNKTDTEYTASFNNSNQMTIDKYSPTNFYMTKLNTKETVLRLDEQNKQEKEDLSRFESLDKWTIYKAAKKCAVLTVTIPEKQKDLYKIRYMIHRGPEDLAFWNEKARNLNFLKFIKRVAPIYLKKKCLFTSRHSVVFFAENQVNKSKRSGEYSVFVLTLLQGVKREEFKKIKDKLRCSCNLWYDSKRRAFVGYKNRVTLEKLKELVTEYNIVGRVTIYDEKKRMEYTLGLNCKQGRRLYIIKKRKTQ